MSMHPAELALGPPIDVLGQLPVGVMLMDARGRVVHRNEALRAMWGGLIHEPADAPFPADAHAPDGTALRPDDWPIRRSLASGKAVDEMPIELERANDDPVSIVADSRPLTDGAGRTVGAVMLVRDITRAHDAAALREAFVGILSHELRSPVTSIYSGIELLRGHALGWDVARDVLDDVAVEAETLQRLIDDLLVMVRVERGLSLGVPEPVHVRHIVRFAVDEERRRWPDRAFQVVLAAELPAAMGDDGLIRQVLRNLLSNAAKYGPVGGTIVVTAAVVDDDIELRVRDDGPGIQLDQRHRVFDLFYRGSTAGRIAGSGIGLYVARVLMEGMGGSIAIADRARGAEFVLRLPACREPDATEPAAG